MAYFFRLVLVSNDTEAPRKNKNPAAMRGGGQRDASADREGSSRQSLRWCQISGGKDRIEFL